VVVVRYFGGTKLGVGGLMNANKTGSKLALEASEIIEKTIDRVFRITFQYKDMNKVMRIVKEKQLKITDQKLELDCQYTIPVRKSKAAEIYDIFNNLFGIEIKELED
jgi:putative IMPACT (imprinted ancient) family translation regulator